MAKDVGPTAIKDTELDELRRYISQLESRSAWAVNEANKYRAARTLRMAGVLGAIIRAPLNPTNWLLAPVRFARALVTQEPEVEPIKRRKFPIFTRGGEYSPYSTEAAPIYESMTIIDSLHQRTLFALMHHQHIIGIADAARLKEFNAEIDFTSIRPDDFDHVAKQTKSTAFVLDLDYAAEHDPFWRGMLSMQNIPVTIVLAKCLHTFKNMRLTLFLVTPKMPHRYSMLSDVREFFDVEIAL